MKDIESQRSEEFNFELQKILAEVKQTPTHINYWKAYKKIQRLNLNKPESAEKKRIKMALLSSFTIDPLIIYLDVQCRLNGLFPEFYNGSFNQVAQEVLDGNSKLYAFSPDVIILAIKAQSLLEEEFYSSFVNLSIKDKELTQSRILDYMKNIVSELTSKTESKILLTNFQVPVFSPLEILDNKNEKGLKDFFQQLNKSLADKYRDNKQVFVVDLDNVAAKHGKGRCINYEMYYRGSYAFSESFLPVIAREFMGYIKALKNLSRKCIVLDLDNTLWGGVLGEEGYDGIKLGKDPPGNAFVDFQRLLLSYYNCGIILAINSNNNLGEVMRVLRDHPYMVLREKHFAAIRVNWQNKAQNMVELAKELNIDLDSMVFVDDSHQNRELIRKELPHVLVVEMPTSCYLYKQTIEDLNDFNTLTLTEEDFKRGELYNTRKKREELKNSTISIEAFLTSLEIKAAVRKAEEFDLPRVTSLVNKTNQFNLTTRRYTDVDIRDMNTNQQEFSIYTLEVSDKFGNEGIVGVAIIQKVPKMWTLNDFLLSCRVMGRGVETAFLSRIVTTAKKQGVTNLIGDFISTEKNAVAGDFYKNNGFEKIAEEKNLSRWKLDLERQTVEIPKWVTIESEQ